MESTRQTSSTELDSVVAEGRMPQPQLTREVTAMAEAIENEFGAAEYFQVHSGPILGSHFSPPSLQVHTGGDNSLMINSHHQSNLGTPSDFLADAADYTGPGLNTPLPVLPITMISMQVLSYSEAVWDLHKPQIRRLYLESGKKLWEVMHQMKEEHGFRPSPNMYKVHLRAWGLFKKNRKKDIIAILGLKKARESAGKSSTMYRSGNPVDIQKIYTYLRRNKLDSRTLEQSKEIDSIIREANHICARTPSPIPPASNLLFPPGILQYKEKILLSINQGYTYWVGNRQESMRNELSEPLPDMFYSAHMCGLNNIDIMSLLFQHGLKLFQANQFSDGGTYIRMAFVFAEFLIKNLSKAGDNGGDEQRLSWIFGLWKLLTSGLPREISRMFLAHMMKLSLIHFSEMHPNLEILRCIYRIHREEGEELFLSFISSIWADAIKGIAILLQSSGLDAAVCLPHNLWFGDTNGLFQFQESLLEFRRMERIESWQQRVTELSFPLCEARQLFHSEPSHTEVLTLMWLRRSLVDAAYATRSSQPSVREDIGNMALKKSLVMTATLTRLELSVGERSHRSGPENVRVLSGDVYQVRYIHGPRSGEDINMFKSKYNLDTHNFELLKNKFQVTGGIETDKTTWLNWLQILEESLIGPWESGQRLESVVSYHCLRGKGFICTSIGTKDGEVGIKKVANGEDDSGLPIEDGFMHVDMGLFQN